MLAGIAASPGIVIGKAFLVQEQTVKLEKETINEDLVESERNRLDQALLASIEQVQSMRDSSACKEQQEIFDAHLMLLKDPVLVNKIKEKISAGRVGAAYATKVVIEEYQALFRNMEDHYFQERAADIADLGARIIRNILGLDDPLKQLSTSNENETIIVARDLTPSDTVHLDPQRVKAFATDCGGYTSHSAILARSLQIPAVVGLKTVTAAVRTGDLLIVDGSRGVVLVNPPASKIREYEARQKQEQQQKLELARLLKLPAETAGGARRIKLAANIGNVSEIEAALANGAEGIGLFRTEFLYMGGDSLPGEEIQYQVYRQAAEKFNPEPVIVRTMDIGGDKKLPFFECGEELNPFLGWRAIRICLDRPDLFKTQLRAILRAAVHGNIKIMYPMIADAAEIWQANLLLQEAKEELDRKRIAFNPAVDVGIMIEVPAAAIIADLLISEVDFFSIGTNDLIQYTMAADRMNEKISYLYEPLHPALLRLIKHVVDASHEAGKWTGMCGEMAADLEAIPLLVGLGLDELSMSAAAIPRAKQAIRTITFERAKQAAAEALSLSSAEEIRSMLATFTAPGGFNQRQSGVPKRPV